MWLAEGAHSHSHSVVCSHLSPHLGKGLPFSDTCATEPLPHPRRFVVASRSGARPDSSAGIVEGWADADGWV